MPPCGGMGSGVTLLLPPPCRAALPATLRCCCGLLQDPRDDVSGEHQVAEDMLDFLQEFFEGERGDPAAAAGIKSTHSTK